MVGPTALKTASVVVTTGGAYAPSDGDFGVSTTSNKRFRIWAWSAVTVDPSQTPGRWRASLTDRPPGSVYSYMSVTGFGGFFLDFPGGLQIGAGVTPGWQVQADGASITFRLYIYYTIEAVS